MGADRTGAVMAMHRIVVQGWKKEDALREMREGGFHFGIEAFARYVESADIVKLRARLAEMAGRWRGRRDWDIPRVLRGLHRSLTTDCADFTDG